MKLPSIKGIDSQQASFILDGDVELFEFFLQKIVIDFSGQITPALQAYLSGQVLESADQLHALRGALANIGALSVVDESKALESQLRDGVTDDLLPGFKTLEQSVNDLFSGIQKHLSNNEEKAESKTKNQTDSLDPEMLNQLILLLKASDTAALDRFEELKPALKPRLDRSEWLSLKVAMDALSFSDAAVILQRLSKSSRAWS